MYICTLLIFEGTHNIQNITVSYSSPGEVTLTGNFINGLAARAILAVVYSDSLSDSNVYYMFSPLSIKEEKLITNVSGLPSGMYSVSVFVVEDNGLPFNRSAATPRNVSVIDEGHGKL